jgi:hypothetical protein
MTADAKLRVLLECAAIMVAPFVVWLALFAVSRWWSVSLRPALGWIRALQWVAWFAGLVGTTLHLLFDRLPLVYGLAALMLAVGLRFPERWLKRHFAPDLLNTANSSEAGGQASRNEIGTEGAIVMGTLHHPQEPSGRSHRS